MNEGTYGLETLKADYHTILGYDIGYLTLSCENQEQFLR